GAGCMRIIPIAKPLLEAGFLEFVEDMKETGHPRLFPLLSAGVNRTTGETNARYSQQFVVDFGRYLKSLGFPKGIGFHAFRHTLATELDVQDVPEKEIALVTGHSTDPRDRVQVLRRHYLHKKPQVTRSKQINALELYQPNVDLPRYQRGQFANCFADPNKFYP
ncbi:integrase, partial [Xanthomonas sp. NCPPB 2922]